MGAGGRASQRLAGEASTEKRRTISKTSSVPSFRTGALASQGFDLFDQRLELRLRPPLAGVAPGEAPFEDGCILVLDLD